MIYENKENLGLGKSRIAATKKLKGELISIIDADDFFHNDKILNKLRFLRKIKIFQFVVHGPKFWITILNCIEILPPK